MDLKKLVPWNWFTKEEESGTKVPVLNPGQPKRAELAGRSENPITRLHEEIERLFDTTFHGLGLPSLYGGATTPLTSTGLLRPRVDVAANEKEYTITVEIPGVTADDVKVELSDDTMIIHGEKKQEKEEKEKNFYRVERSYGSFQRVLSLPKDADEEHINATFKNGVLEVKILRKEMPDTGVKKIEIK